MAEKFNPWIWSFNPKKWLWGRHYGAIFFGPIGYVCTDKKGNQ